MDLTQQEIQVLLEIIGKMSIPVEQAEQIVLPIKNKLQIQLVKLSQPEKKETLTK